MFPLLWRIQGRWQAKDSVAVIGRTEDIKLFWKAAMACAPSSAALTII